ncbi:glutathione S-transferase family protein [Rhodobacteraceae bacterium RKSG542]|uniref:glutathione S-transferase N-terminal domain-containing protein n=1 Tax=Pseudovibrio flavus TaxID=2529854 RepID=UPI0012BC4439|nr:glutathione S-transferase N-terminal domain-containing protein [Pseudovibrio flavus]MTI16343.1 glutathione S-transferase family protein [Pseudovibrio flavus]
MAHEQTKPIELYYWPTPNGWKISVMLEELGVPYDLKLVDISKGDQFKPEFLEVSPNNRMPAIIDPEGPDGKPISVFESGAILQYLGRKFEQFYPTDERARVEVEEWLMWQMGGFGPMLGQNHHFRIYAPEKLEYAMNRYLNETHRLYGVLNKRLKGREYIAGEYSIADIACIGWSQGWERQGMDLEEFPEVRSWRERLLARPAVARGLELGLDLREKMKLAEDKDAQSVLFGQRSK